MDSAPNSPALPANFSPPPPPLPPSHWQLPIRTYTPNTRTRTQTPPTHTHAPHTRPPPPLPRPTPPPPPSAHLGPRPTRAKTAVHTGGTFDDDNSRAISRYEAFVILSCTRTL